MRNFAQVMLAQGGFGIAEAYDIKRKFGDTRVYQMAPSSPNLVLSYVAEHVLGMPRSLLAGMPKSRGSIARYGISTSVRT